MYRQSIFIYFQETVIPGLCPRWMFGDGALPGIMYRYTIPGFGSWYKT